MKAPERYDSVIYGESLAGWVAAWALARHGERVLIIQRAPPANRVAEARAAETASRLAFGLESGGIVRQFLVRWGMPADFLDGAFASRPRIDVFSPQRSLDLRAPLNENTLGSLPYELRQDAVKGVLRGIAALEQDTVWPKKVVDQMLSELARSREGWRKRLPARSVPELWRKALLSAIKVPLRSMRFPSVGVESARNAGYGDFFEGVSSLAAIASPVIRGDAMLRWIAQAVSVRQAPFVKEREFRERMRTWLTEQGVEFREPDETVVFRRAGSSWEGLFGRSDRSAQISLQAKNLILAEPIEETDSPFVGLSPESGVYRTADSRRVEWCAVVPSESLPYADQAELRYADGISGPVRFAIWGVADETAGLPAGKSRVLVSADLPGDADVENEERLARRLKREITAMMPTLAMQNLQGEMFRSRRFLDFRQASGPRTADAQLWDLSRASYWEQGRAGPFIAALEATRLILRRERKEFQL